MPTLGRGGPPIEIPSTSDLDLTYEEISGGEVIGQGGNADVYRVSVERNGRTIPLAVKQPRLGGTLRSDMLEQFVEEAEVWNKLDGHDHVVSLIDWGSEPLPWIAMEYMDGGTLDELLADGRLPLDQAVWVALCVCRAVRYAHRHGVAHHDIKPANVLFRVSDEGWSIPKVSDWGLARMMLDETGSVDGLSPQYAAPEQFDSTTYGSPDDITDIYQLGVLAYELTTGSPPFEGSATTVMQGILNDEPDPPSTVADVPESIDSAIMPALARNKADRYDSVVYLRDALEGVFETLRDSSEPAAGKSAVNAGVAPQDDFLAKGGETTSRPDRRDERPTTEHASGQPRSQYDAGTTAGSDNQIDSTAEDRSADGETTTQRSTGETTANPSRRSYLKAGAGIAGVVGLLGAGLTLAGNDDDQPRDDPGTAPAPGDDGDTTDQVAFPSDDLEIIVPGGAGSISDIYGRLAASHLDDRFSEVGVNVRNIEDGVRAVAEVFNADDPHVSGVINTRPFVAPQFGDSVEYDLGEFTWLAQITERPECLYVGDDSGITTMDGFIERIHFNDVRVAHHDTTMFETPLGGTVLGEMGGLYATEDLFAEMLLYPDFGQVIESTTFGESDAFFGPYMPVENLDGIEILLVFDLGEPPEGTLDQNESTEDDHDDHGGTLTTGTLTTEDIDRAESIRNFTINRNAFAAPPGIDGNVRETLADGFGSAIDSDAFRSEAEENAPPVEYLSAEEVETAITETLREFEENPDVVEALFR